MKIALKAEANGKYVTAEDRGESPLIANRNIQAHWETFTIERLKGQQIALKAAANGKYVTAENATAGDCGGFLIANRDHVGVWEVFIIEILSSSEDL